MSDGKNPTNSRPTGFSITGSVLLFGAIALIALSIIHKSFGGLPFEMPRSWYSHPALWFVCSILAGLIGGVLLRAPEVSLASWQPTVPGRRFQSIVIYTRANCPLCDIANEVLARYAAYVPPSIEVDIDNDSELKAKYNEWVPVIEIDGRVRFRGQINEIMLRRLIQGTAPSELKVR